MENRACGCGKRMNWQLMANPDGGRWQCGFCKSTKELRADSFFTHCKVPLNKLVLLMLLWSSEDKQRYIAAHTRLSAFTVSRWCGRLREIVSQHIEKNRHPIVGASHVILVDESHLAKHRPGNNRIARVVPSIGLYGAPDKKTKETVARIVPVSTGCTRETMEQLIREAIRPHSEI